MTRKKPTVRKSQGAPPADGNVPAADPAADLVGTIFHREIKEIPIDGINLDSQKHPRKHSREDIERLAQSIGDVGLLNPVTVNAAKNGSNDYNLV